MNAARWVITLHQLGAATGFALGVLIPSELALALAGVFGFGLVAMVAQGVWR